MLRCLSTPLPWLCAQYLVRFNLTSIVGPDSKVTAFAPTNAAFEKLVAAIGEVPDDDDVLVSLQGLSCGLI